MFMPALSAVIRSAYHLQWSQYFNGKVNCSIECTKKCPEVSHCTEVIYDPCDCCPICIRFINESCGSGIGICKENLRCRQDDPNIDSGICVGRLNLILYFICLIFNVLCHF
ncbi:unnamed protein product [Dracunculus medinensis]|uniref:IGFBP N-terminal domain-containing protein n=1 Tax=Dracunculus medinensis TaxID=318479 RepID=A0A0N4UPC2_DRAME|nr:unnamed protein product [Dracunculus medinensis]